MEIESRQGACDKKSWKRVEFYVTQEKSSVKFHPVSIGSLQLLTHKTHTRKTEE